VKFADMPTIVRRTVDQLVEQSGFALRRRGDPYLEGANFVVPFDQIGAASVFEAVVSPAGAGTLRRA
jgi:hypothetical protein